jgi:hypothetical protein
MLGSARTFYVNENTLPYNATPVGTLAYTLVPFDYDSWQTHTFTIRAGNNGSAFMVRRAPASLALCRSVVRLGKLAVDRGWEWNQGVVPRRG